MSFSCHKGKSNLFEPTKKKSPGTKVGSDASKKSIINKKKPAVTENEWELDEDLALLAAAEDDDFEETFQKKESSIKSSKDAICKTSPAVTPSKEDESSKVLKTTVGLLLNLLAFTSMSKEVEISGKYSLIIVE